MIPMERKRGVIGAVLGIPSGALLGAKACARMGLVYGPRQAITGAVVGAIVGGVVGGLAGYAGGTELDRRVDNNIRRNIAARLATA